MDVFQPSPSDPGGERAARASFCVVEIEGTRFQKYQILLDFTYLHFVGLGERFQMRLWSLPSASIRPRLDEENGPSKL